jgi:hypothetical protein
MLAGDEVQALRDQLSAARHHVTPDVNLGCVLHYSITSPQDPMYTCGPVLDLCSTGFLRSDTQRGYRCSQAQRPPSRPW